MHQLFGAAPVQVHQQPQVSYMPLQQPQAGHPGGSLSFIPAPQPQQPQPQQPPPQPASASFFPGAGAGVPAAGSYCPPPAEPMACCGGQPQATTIHYAPQQAAEAPSVSIAPAQYVTAPPQYITPPPQYITGPQHQQFTTMAPSAMPTIYSAP